MLFSVVQIRCTPSYLSLYRTYKSKDADFERFFLMML